MKLGYIQKINLEMNPHLTERFRFKETTFTRRITSKGDRIYSKMFYPLKTAEVFYIDTKYYEIFKIDCDDMWIEPREDGKPFYYIGDFVFIKKDFGLKVFLTKEEAQKRLEELKGESDGK